MKHTLGRGLIGACTVLFACCGFAETNIIITAFHGNGMLSWTAGLDTVSATIEWAPSVTGPWTNTWERLVDMPNTGSTHTVAVPMFYRVVGTQTPKATFLVHGDGIDGGTTFTDVCGHAVTAAGDAHISTNESVFGGASAHFDGNGDYLSSPNSSDWGFGTNDFTVDLRVRFSSLPAGNTHLIGLQEANVSGDWILFHDGSSLRFQIANAAGEIAASWAPSVNIWYHLAVVRKNGHAYLFVNGQPLADGALGQSIGHNHTLSIGAAENALQPFAGYVDEVRVVSGTAVWTTTFTLPVVPYQQ